MGSSDGLTFGVPVKESKLATETVEVTERRTWKERLLSWPWRPWVAERTRTEHRPTAYEIQCRYGKMLIVHPEIMDEVRAQTGDTDD